MLKTPALDPATVSPRTGAFLPEPYRSRVVPRDKRALGDAVGLTRIGVNLSTLLPGKESSIRHYHSHEDEFIFVLEGEVVLITEQGEQLLTPGMCAGFPAGTRDGHQLVNRTDRPARYLEMSNRDPRDTVEYPGEDLQCVRDSSGTPRFSKKDGTPY